MIDRLAGTTTSPPGPGADPGWLETPGRRWGALVLSVAAVTGVAAIGGVVTDTGAGSWYDGLDQPAWNPPDWLFGPVWTALYLAMALAAWRVAVRLPAPGTRPALALYAVQLVLNLGWTLVFFGGESLIGGVVVIAALWLTLAATIAATWPVDHIAGGLLVPYLAWVSYAGALTVGIAVLN